MQTRNNVLVARVLLASMPIFSFVAQLILSRDLGRDGVFWRHPTVVYLDWLFVPFNFFVVRVIDWRRGARIFTISCSSIVLNAAAHAWWQVTNADAGHMISSSPVPFSFVMHGRTLVIDAITALLGLVFILLIPSMQKSLL